MRPYIDSPDYQGCVNTELLQYSVRNCGKNKKKRLLRESNRVIKKLLCTVYNTTSMLKLL